jgi:hypothetical protein
MAKSLFSKNEDCCCGICVYGHPASDPSKVLCRKKGVVDASSRCRRYKYDPLKRVPRHAPELPHFDSGDFTL